MILLATIAHCVAQSHDHLLVVLAALVCGVGVYATFAIARHAARAEGVPRRRWALVSVVAGGCTAWATHFIVLLAFEPGIDAAFDPSGTVVSLACAIAGIGAGILVSMGSRRSSRQFVAGVVIGVGIAGLHYIGQSAYLVRGSVSWSLPLVLASMLVGVPVMGLGMMTLSHRRRRFRRAAPPLLLLSIAILHFCGMSAMTLHGDSAVVFPSNAMSPSTVAPWVAGVSTALLTLAVVGWRFDLAAKARWRHDQKRLRELADVALEGLLICRGDEVITANQSIERLSDYSAGTLAGFSLSKLLPGVDFESMPEREEREAQLLTAGDGMIPVRVLRSQVALGHKVQTVIAVRDQRERLRTEARMRTLAFNDALTGVANRTRFFDLLSIHAASRRSNDQSFAVLMIDLDRFKPINDSMGHAAGDTILRMVAERLQSTLRDGDVLARLGGDEFAILQVSADHLDSVAVLAHRLVQTIGERPFTYLGQALHLAASVGFAWAPHDGDDPAELLRNADLALYAAKADGRATSRRYDPRLDEQTQERRRLEIGLRHAIDGGELELHYQPLMNAKSGEITGAEALVRWNHPGRGLIPPIDFIGLAEETGLILPLGDWVLRTACAQAATWPVHITVAVNLSPAQFRDPTLSSVVLSALSSSGLAPNRLELEITEGVLLNDEARTLATLACLKEAGVRISMDDFGTGYSSLSYLRKFPFDKIKIDQSFVRQIPEDPESAAIIRAIITMSSCLGIATTVEGVETGEQLAFSVAEGCDTIQGYHISRPLNEAAFQRVLEVTQPIMPTTANRYNLELKGALPVA
ncbi:EAL domain-containing protein [Sphingomonas yunnanensis]|uniref:bifunctional diguanylate cyclase/phosphodiesterase n=1 Tax=Sphingomonas yunnanensis TaxID=310400 RepID=UPI001CA71B01|nr:EAL domain-containing protein [Sphingomonas yunnanensis]MBY9062522.1 EAL domain-containing protein [Sphingomonas yunnanensis]